MSDGVELFLLRIKIGSSIVSVVEFIVVCVPSTSRFPLITTALESYTLSFDPPGPVPAWIVGTASSDDEANMTTHSEDHWYSLPAQLKDGQSLTGISVKFY